jgi:hypothetical protein
VTGPGVTAQGGTRRWRCVLSAWPLLYLAMLVAQPLADPATGPFEWAVAAAAVVVFVPVYLVAEFRGGAVRQWSPG